MEFGGVIEEALAWLYPNRVLVAAITTMLAIVIAVVGYHRGWHHVARRHPRVTITIVLLALAVGSPIAWILGSPLLIRTELVEAAPSGVVAVASPSPVADTASPSRGTPGRSRGSAAPSARPTPSPTQFAARTVLRGTFKGADDFHFGSGTALLVETAPGTYVLRLERFSVRNGPDLYVYLSPDADGYTRGAVELGRLKATDGSFNYALPAGADVTAIRSAVVWCKAFSVQFAHATLAD